MTDEEMVQFQVSGPTTMWKNSLLLWVAVLVVGQVLVMAALFLLIVKPVNDAQDRSRCRSEIYSQLFVAQANALRYQPDSPERKPWLDEMVSRAQQLDEEC